MNLNYTISADVIEGLKTLPDECIDTCVTSPPYWMLRDYKVDGQLGMERTPEEYIENQVGVFREVRRVLKKQGTLWVNIGDSYYGGNTQPGGGSHNGKHIRSGTPPKKHAVPGLKPKDLVGIPWLLAFALRADGWYLRSDIIWAKKNCMPESVTDRPTKAHEYIFLLTKSSSYYYDHEAIKEPAIYNVDGAGTAARKASQKHCNKSMRTGITAGTRPAGFKDATKANGKHSDKQRGHSRRHAGFNEKWDNMTKEEQCTGMRNKRDVWHMPTAQFPEAHFATFPPELPELCIKAGCPEGGVVLDPYMGAHTTALVARKLNRNYIGIELNAEYIRIGEARLKKELGMFL